MFTFFSDVKARLTALEDALEAIFAHLHTEFAKKTVAAETEVGEVVAEPLADVAEKATAEAAVVEADVTKAL